MDIAVLILAHNDAESVAETVTVALAIDGVTRAVVVDNGSEDETAVLAQRAGAKVIRMLGNAGRGGAFGAGAKRVEGADIIVVIDADLGAAAGQAACLLEPVVSGAADMTIATSSAIVRPARTPLAVKLARWGIARYGDSFDASEPLSSQRVFTRECFTTARPFSAGYGVDVGLTIRALRAGLRVLEVPTAMHRPQPGRDIDGFVHRGRQLVHVALALARLSREAAPERATHDYWR